MRRLLPFAGLLLAPLALLAQQRVLDANHDGAIDRAEAAAHPRMAQAFDHLDRDHDGRITASERPQHKGKRGHRGIERLDADHDGRISRAEFDAAHARRAAHPQPGRADARKHAAMDFAAVDANRDGYLVRTELRAWHERLRPQREAERKARFETRFRDADLNRDGKLGRVEVQEKLPRLAERFAWMDDNRDGFLSREELRPSRGHH